MIEYSLDIDLPDHVFDNEIIKAMSDATTDIMTWPNVSFKIFNHVLKIDHLSQDLCSLNVSPT